MERPFSQTLSFDDLEFIVLMEDGGATPREVGDSLGMSRSETKAVFQDLVWRGLLDWEGRSHVRGALLLPWSFVSTLFRLTPMARIVRRDETFTSTAFAASLVVAAPNTKG
jgi:hypothetical protein